jgi:hypothetical protein
LLSHLSVDLIEPGPVSASGARSSFGRCGARMRVMHFFDSRARVFFTG